MAKNKEFEGRTLQEALQDASDKTGIAEPDLDYKILEQGRRGLFGIGAKSVRISVMPPLGGLDNVGNRKAGATPARTERPRGRGRGRGGDRGAKPGSDRLDDPRAIPAGAANELRGVTQDGEDGGPRKRRRRRRRGKRTSEGGTPEGQRQVQSGDRAATPESASNQNRNEGRNRNQDTEGSETPARRRRGGRGRRGRGSEDRRSDRGPRREGRPAQPVDVKPEDVEKVQETVQRMMELMQLDVQVQAIAAETGIQLLFEGEDREILVARDGELINNVRFILNRMGRRAWPDSGRILTRPEKVLRERDADLIELVREVIQQVETSSEPKRLHPMNAYERRLVHIEVRKTPGVGSHSDGEGDSKRVTIYPDPDDSFNEAGDPEAQTDRDDDERRD